MAEYLANTNMIEIINGHIIRSKNTQEELETRIKTMLVSFDTSLRSMLKAAEYSGEMFRMLSRGQLKVNMEMLGSTEPLRKVSRIANRLAMSLVIAGLLVSGSLIISVDMPRVFGLPILSFIEYVSAFVLFIWMAWDMFRKTRRP